MRHRYRQAAVTTYVLMKAHEQLQQVFQLARNPRPLEDLRAPAGTFDQTTAQGLALEGLVEYDTRTGIAFQTSEDWDLLLTEQGRRVLEEQD